MVITPTPLENVLIIVGEGFWVLSGLSQLRHSLKKHNTKGLSSVSTVLNGAGSIAWATYFALNHLWYPFFTNILMVMIAVSLVGLILNDRKKFHAAILAIITVGPLTSFILLAFPDQAGWLGMLYNWIASTPWLIKVVTGKRVSGISEKALYISVGAMLCVLSYGLLIRAAPLIAGSIQGLAYTAIIFNYYYRHRHLN